VSSVVTRLEKISKSFETVVALESVSVELGEGEIFGCVGPNGAGKTTAIRLLLGLLKPDAGTVELFGANPYLDHLTSLKARSRVGAMLDSPGHFIYTTAQRNLNYYAHVRRVSNANQRVAEVLRLVGLYEQRHQRVETFSRGMLQRLAFARTVVHDPDFLVLDEPTSGLDPGGQQEVRKMLERLASSGKTVLLSSHNLAEVEETCTRVAIINKGRIIVCDKIETLRAQYERPAVRLRFGTDYGRTEKDQLEKRMVDLPYVIQFLDGTEELVVQLHQQSDAVKLNQFLVSSGVPVAQMSTFSVTLQDIYEELIMEKSRSDDRSDA